MALVESLLHLAKYSPLRGQLRQFLLLIVKIPDSRLTTTLESNREHLTLLIIYNIRMSDHKEHFDVLPAPSLDERLAKLAIKLETLQERIKVLIQEKYFMENKISDAQGRIQKILSKLPQANDSRQLTLLDTPAKTPHE